MSTNNDNPSNTSRRNVIKGIAIVAVSSATAGLTSAFDVANASSKCPGTVPKNVLSYRDHPKGSYDCASCANFIAPSCCMVVKGPISPKGWCSAYAPKGA